MSNNKNKVDDKVHKKVDEKVDENVEEKETDQSIAKINYDSFDSMDFLNFDLLKGIFDYGFKSPSRIQNIAIKEIFDGFDIIAQSQSGTGKTGAFTIGSLSILNPEEKNPQIIVLATTRDLATQIFTVYTNISKYMNISVQLCIGGTRVKTNYNKDPYRNIRTAQVLVGTPGRIHEYIKLKAFDPQKLKLFVLDEADALLKEDFIEQIKNIIVELDANTQIAIFSATYPRAVLEIANSFMSEPKQILLKRDNLSLDLIKQYKIYVKFDDYKYATLVDLYKNLLIGQCIIFVNSIKSADDLTKKLDEDGYAVGRIHGALDGIERNDVLKNFRIGLIRVLIATDILSRGIDVEQIGIVINYDIPRDRAQYIHRIGRSGRFGKIGVAINFVTDRDSRTIHDLEYFYKTRIGDMPDFQVVLSQLSGLKGYIKMNLS
jgi:translation initiation factor 4A